MSLGTSSFAQKSIDNALGDYFSDILDQEKYGQWGFGAHRYINNHAVDYLPAEMSFFLEHRDYLELHSTDPDVDSSPRYYHWIDIDYYPEFTAGNFPHDLDSLIDLYGDSIVQIYGIIPWVVEQRTDRLSALMTAGDWGNAWQIAAELGHFVAAAEIHRYASRKGGSKL